MTRYNESADERAFVSLYDQFEGDGYREGVERVLWWLKECGEYAYDFELRQAIKAGII